ncbi:MAG: DMT family transporter [Patescibacteria group bacterium]
MFKNKSSLQGITYLIISTLIYSIMPVLIRFLSAEQMPPNSQVFLRYIVAFSAAAIYFFVISKSKFKVHKKDLPLLILVGIFGYGLTNLLFTYGIIYTQVSNALFIFYCYAIITPVLGFIFLKEKVRQVHLIAFSLSLVALLFLFQPNNVSTWRLGGILAFGSALTQSFYLIGRKKLVEYSSQFILLVSTFLGMVSVGLSAFIFESTFYFGPNGIHSLSSAAWMVTLLFGMGNFLAWLFMSKGFALVTTSTGSLVMLMENVFALFFVFMFFQEIPTLTTFFGGILIFTAIILVILKGES